MKTTKNSYKDVKVLLSDLKQDIEDVLMNEVLDEVRDIELKHIQEEVLSSYSPQIYRRRMTSGIDDPSNIVGEVYDMQLVVDNITRFNDDYGSSNHGVGLADLVNDGDSLQGYFYDYPGKFNLPRPFIDKTIEEIEQGDNVEKALIKGLKKKKYDVK